MDRRRNSPRSTKRLVSLQREQEAVRLRMAGKSYRAIAAELGISTTHVFRLVDQALSRIQQESEAEVRVLQRLELERLDELHKALWPLATGDHPSCRAAGLLLRISEQRFKLLGLENYRLFELTGANGGPVQVQHERKFDPESNGLRDLLRGLIESDPRVRNT